jgi:beta-glucosidase-like glycosyl hydrolase
MFKYIEGLSPFIFGISGLFLSDEEKAFLKFSSPYGVILFTRNLESREQIKKLNQEIHSIVPGIKIFIDQEGGRVQRIKPPIGIKKYQAQKYFGDLYKEDRAKSIEELEVNYLCLSAELKDLGFNVTCAPVCDLYHSSADHSIIGDRSFSDNAEVISLLSLEALEIIRKNSIEGVVKHIPGHGRSTKDSHKTLPIITTELEILEKTDFKIFKDLSKSVKYAMTAHIVYTALDPVLPCTLSSKVITYIREKIGFEGIIITDDICMKALSGDIKNIAKQSFEAGCDILMHCSGELDQMQEIFKYCPIEK